MKWFGEPWPSAEVRAPICEDDADRIPTPVGEPCLWCMEPIEDGDQGEAMPALREDGWTTSYGHRECLFRQVVGGPAHIGGTCTCQGGCDDPDLGMTPREAGRWVWAHYEERQAP